MVIEDPSRILAKGEGINPRAHPLASTDFGFEYSGRYRCRLLQNIQDAHNEVGTLEERGCEHRLAAFHSVAL